MPRTISRRTAGKVLAGLPLLATAAGRAATAQGGAPSAGPLARLLGLSAPPDLTARPPIGYFFYARLDLLSGAAGPAATPGATRLSAGPHGGQGDAVALAYTEIRQARTQAAGWPQLAGFDLDAIDAVLVPLAVAANSPSPPVLLAGAPRLFDAGAIGRALEARGAARRMEAGRPVWSFAEFAPRQGDEADPLRGRMGKPAKVATLPQALLIAYEDDDLTAMLRAASAGPTMADTPGMLALVHALGENGSGSAVVQAFCFPPLLWAEIPDLTSGPSASLAAPSPPVLPPYWLGGTAQLRLADGSRRDRVALFYPERGAAQAGAAAMQERVRGWEAGPQRIGLTGIASRVEPVADGAMAVLEVTPATAPGADGRPPSPFLAWNTALISRQPMPMTVGPTPPFRRD